MKTSQCLRRLKMSTVIYFFAILILHHILQPCSVSSIIIKPAPNELYESSRVDHSSGTGHPYPDSKILQNVAPWSKVHIVHNLTSSRTKLYCMDTCSCVNDYTPAQWKQWHIHPFQRLFNIQSFLLVGC